MPHAAFVSFVRAVARHPDKRAVEAGFIVEPEQVGVTSDVLVDN
jgi:hypothetical protein